MKKIIVAIDGYSSCGKSTIAKDLARYAGYTYVDTGAMYRAVALFMMTDPRCQTPEPVRSLVSLLPEIDIRFALQADGSQHLLLNGEDVESRIRSLEVGSKASEVSPVKEVRRYLVEAQQRMGADKGIVMDGRDIGTVVFPNAELKLFLTASPEVRAKRRFDELVAKGELPVYADVLQDVNTRDYRDTHRTESPLRKAEDAVVIDNSHLTREEQMQVIRDIFNKAVKD